MADADDLVLSPFFDEVFPKLNHVRADEKYCDVNIRVKDYIFPCHRVLLASASEFFDLMFSGNFKESTSPEIVLQDVDVCSFTMILNYIYRGMITLTPRNAFGVLTLSEYLGMPYIEKASASYLEKHISPNNVVDVLHFAYNTKRTGLMFAACKIVAENFIHCVSIDKLQGMPTEVFRVIFSHEQIRDNYDCVLEFLVKWTRRDSGREKYLPALLKKIGARKFPMSVTCLADLMMNKFSTSESEYEEKSVQNDDLIKDDDTFKLPAQKYFLEILVYHSDIETYKIYKWKETDNFESEWKFKRNVSCMGTLMGDCKSVRVNQHLYTLYAYYDIMGDVGMFFNRRSIFDYIDEPKTNLRLPCKQFDNFSLAPMDSSSTVYLYYKDYPQDKDSRIHRYDCITDSWYPVTSVMNSPIQHVDHACVAALNSVLYVLDGHSSDGTNDDAGQYYDPRCDKWYSIPPKAFKRRDAAACNYNEKLYVSGGVYLPGEKHVFDAFDPIAGKWNYIEGPTDTHVGHALIPFDGDLWEIGGWSDNRKSKLLNSMNVLIDVGHHSSDWYTISLENVLPDEHVDLREAYVKDGFVREVF